MWIEALKLVPRPPYQIEAYDVLRIRGTAVLVEEQLDDYFLVNGDGFVDLGPAYGIIRVQGMSIEGAAREITLHLRQFLQNPHVSVQLVRSEGVQQITGGYVVQPDGTVNLGRYGMAYVTGMTVTEAKVAIEEQLVAYFDSPQVTVTVTGYNSQSYYVVVGGAGLGENVQRFPIAGNETVLDAIAQVQGLTRVSSKTMWVARTAPNANGCDEILPVNWAAIARGGVTDTNYQLLPGDRLFVVNEGIVASDSYLSELTGSPQRLLSISSLGASAILDSQTLGRSYNQNR